VTAVLLIIGELVAFWRPILTADRGYPSYNLMETVNRNPNMDYLIRTPRNSFYFLKDLPYEQIAYSCSYFPNILSKSKKMSASLSCSHEASKMKLS
jgi:hypothetical protein